MGSVRTIPRTTAGSGETGNYIIFFCLADIFNFFGGQISVLGFILK